MSRIDGAPIPSPSTPSYSFHELIGLASNPNPSLDFTPFENDNEKSMKMKKCCKSNLKYGNNGEPCFSKTSKIQSTPS
jgi:hypothetical protein